MKKLFLTPLFLFSILGFSQQKASDIWMMNITMAAGKMNAAKPVSISGKNSYSDEPAFSPDGKFIFFTSHSDSFGHTEIYKYQMKTKTAALFTASAEDKRTPAIMPGGKYVSYIVNEEGSHSRLWRMPVAGGTAEPIMKEKDSIGNYCWMTGDSIAMQILSSPPSLQAASTSTGISKTVAQNVGNCIRRMPTNGPVPGKWDDIWIFSEKTRDNVRTLKSIVYGKKGKVTVMPLCPSCNMMEGTENFTLIRGGIYIPKGSKIFRMDDASAEGWTEVADLAKYGIKNITFITFSPDEKKLVVVSDK